MRATNQALRVQLARTNEGDDMTPDELKARHLPDLRAIAPKPERAA